MSLEMLMPTQSVRTLLKSTQQYSFNMRSCAMIFLTVVVAGVVGEQYTDRYDTVDLSEVLSNRRLLVPYVKCMLDLGKCTPEGKELRSHISDALQTGCSKCTRAQRSGSRQVIAHLIRHEPDYWNQLVSKYDPERVYTTRYEKELANVA